LSRGGGGRVGWLGNRKKGYNYFWKSLGEKAGIGRGGEKPELKSEKRRKKFTKRGCFKKKPQNERGLTTFPMLSTSRSGGGGSVGSWGARRGSRKKSAGCQIETTSQVEGAERSAEGIGEKGWLEKDWWSKGSSTRPPPAKK